jgi:predicted nucleotidyltransferase
MEPWQFSLEKLWWQCMVSSAKIRSFCNAVAQQFRPRKIILFGSHAYGRPNIDSDVDLLVIMPCVRRGGERMSVRIRHAVPRDFPLDLLVRTPMEVAKGLRQGDFFMREIMTQGKVMYETHNS